MGLLDWVIQHLHWCALYPLEIQNIDEIPGGLYTVQWFVHKVFI